MEPALYDNAQKAGNKPMQPSGEVGRYEVDEQPSPPGDRYRYPNQSMSDEFNLVDATKAGLRASATAVLALAPFVQVWNEHEALELSRRVDRFWQAFVNESNLLQGRIDGIEKTVQVVADAVKIVQASLESARRETVAEKQELMGKAAARLIVMGDSSISRDLRLSVVDGLDSLTLTDIEWLRAMRGYQRVKVAELLPQSNEERLGTLVLSLSKLESRGLIGQTDRPSFDTNAWTGSAEHWANQWRQRFYCVLPSGNALLESVD